MLKSRSSMCSRLTMSTPRCRYSDSGHKGRLFQRAKLHIFIEKHYIHGKNLSQTFPMPLKSQYLSTKRISGMVHKYSQKAYEHATFLQGV